MSQPEGVEFGTIAWADLSVVNAEQVRNFYQDVVGWKASNVEMGDYQDFCMQEPANGKIVAGICHARGRNADMPPQWLVYLTVPDLENAITKCVAKGGRIVAGPKTAGNLGRYCVIQDPAGAVAALLELAKS